MAYYQRGNPLVMSRFPLTAPMEVDFFLLLLFWRCLCGNLLLGVINDSFIGIAIILLVRHVFHIARFTELDGNGIDGQVR